MKLQEAGEIATILGEKSDGNYSTNMEMLEHGGRLLRALDDNEKIKTAGYATRFEGTRSGCGIVLTKRRFFLLPESRYFRATQAAWGAARGRGDIVEVPYSSVKRVEAYRTEESAGVIGGLFRSRYTNDNLRIIFTNNESITLESIMGDGRHHVILDRFRKYI